MASIAGSATTTTAAAMATPTVAVTAVPSSDVAGGAVGNLSSNATAATNITNSTNALPTAATTTNTNTNTNTTIANSKHNSMTITPASALTSNNNNNNSANSDGHASSNVNVANSAAVVVANKLTADKSNVAHAAHIAKSYAEIIKQPSALDASANYMLQELVDDAIVGVFLEIHHLRKSGNLDAMEGVPEEEAEKSFRIVNQPNYDIFGSSTAKKPMDCICPNCDRPVSAARFATHLEKCMGMGRISSRIASRRLATKDGNSASSSSATSYIQTNAGTDDEDDVDWSSEKRRKKANQNARNNGSKKNNGKTSF